MAMITISGNSFDPISEPPSSPPPVAFKSNYILLQTDPSLTDKSRAELAALGVTILEYLPLYSYLCRYEKEDLQPIRALEYVAWVEDYHSRFKLPPNLAGRCEKEVDIVFHDNVNPEELREAVAKAAHVDPAELNLGSRKARAAIQPRYLPAVAAIDEVRYVEEVRTPRVFNNVAREILGLVSVNGNSETPFEGEGQIVVVADTGFHNGSKKDHDVHPAFKSGSKNRVLELYSLGRPGKADDPVGHGTHVAGSVLGDGESEQFGKIRGTAPKAGLIVQSLLDENNKLKPPADLHDLFSTPYHDHGARIHNNSWGSLLDPGPDHPAREVDDFVFKHPDFVVCIAAGNEGNDILKTGEVAGKTITSPGTAKNCITVGATESRRGFNTSYGDLFSPNFPIGSQLRGKRIADDPESVALISSRGPAEEYRIKPDVVAPGTFILSAKSIAQAATSDFGWRGGDDEFIFHGGTSMATPLVAGCAALVREFLANRHQIDKPSAALVKALLINGAQPLNGSGVAPELAGIPNSNEGFGRVNVPATVGPFPAGTNFILRDERDTGLKHDESSPSLEVTVTPPTSLLKVTLVWTDPPGAGLQNDLDLIVRAANGEKRHGNKPPGSNEFDRANNVEQITWKGIPAGPAQIIVYCHRLIPTSLSQKYALVIRTA